MDLTIQARAGFMSVTGDPDRPPVKAGPAVCDFLGGAHLYGGIVTALFERERTGRGRVVEVSMLEEAFPALASAMGMHYSSGGSVPPRTGSRHAGLAMAPYNVYPARDGYVAIICTTDEHWQQLCVAMGRGELAGDARYETHTERSAIMDEVDDLVAGWTSGLARDEVWTLCRAHRVPAAPVRDLTEVLADRHLHERGYLVEVDHPEMGRVTLPRSPIRYEGSPLPELVPSPELGQHTEDVLGEWLGLDPRQVADLRAEGAV
jgi:crotonobetainyl-CoA:carnitine CoA-transferase CaiB-like acyl-CoA transferase